MTSGVARIWCQGARRSRRRRREHRGAEWGGVWGGVSAPQPTRESGGASWAPPAGSGAEPRLLSHFLHILGHINWELLEKFQIPLWKSGGDSYQHFQKWWWQVVTSLHRHIQSAPMSCGVVCDPTFSRFSRTPTCDAQTDIGPWLVPRVHSIAR